MQTRTNGKKRTAQSDPLLLYDIDKKDAPGVIQCQ